MIRRPVSRGPRSITYFDLDNDVGRWEDGPWAGGPRNNEQMVAQIGSGHSEVFGIAFLRGDEPASTRLQWS